MPRVQRPDGGEVGPGQVIPGMHEVSGVQGDEPHARRRVRREAEAGIGRRPMRQVRPGDGDPQEPSRTVPFLRRVSAMPQRNGDGEAGRTEAQGGRRRDSRGPARKRRWKRPDDSRENRQGQSKTPDQGRDRRAGAPAEGICMDAHRQTGRGDMAGIGAEVF